MEERIARLEARVDATEARLIAHDRTLDAFVSDVGDARATASQVLARLETLDRIDDALRLTREDHAATRARVTILMAISGAVGVAVLGLLVKLLVR